MVPHLAPSSRIPTMAAPPSTDAKPDRIPILSFFTESSRSGLTKKGMGYTKEAARMMAEVKQYMNQATRAEFEERLEEYSSCFEFPPPTY